MSDARIAATEEPQDAKGGGGAGGADPAAAAGASVGADGGEKIFFSDLFSDDPIVEPAKRANVPALYWSTKEELKDVVVHGPWSSNATTKIRCFLKAANVPFTHKPHEDPGAEALKEYPTVDIGAHRLDDGHLIMRFVMPALSYEFFYEWEDKIVLSLEPALQLHASPDDWRKLAGYTHCVKGLQKFLMGRRESRREKDLCDAHLEDEDHKYEEGDEKSFAAEFKEAMAGKFFHGDAPGHVDISFYGMIAGFLGAGAKIATRMIARNGLENWADAMQKRIPLESIFPPSNRAPVGPSRGGNGPRIPRAARFSLKGSFLHQLRGSFRGSFNMKKPGRQARVETSNFEHGGAPPVAAADKGKADKGEANPNGGDTAGSTSPNGSSGATGEEVGDAREGQKKRSIFGGQRSRSARRSLGFMEKPLAILSRRSSIIFPPEGHKRRNAVRKDDDDDDDDGDDGDPIEERLQEVAAKLEKFAARKRYEERYNSLENAEEVE